MIKLKKMVGQNRSFYGVVMTAVLLAASGCSKKQEPAVTQNAPVPQTPGSPQTPTAQPPENNMPADARLAEAQAAMKAKDYERAINTLAIPRQPAAPMTAQQMMDIHNAQISMQNQIAEAAAAGDPKAKAAYEALRQRSLYHR
jgi:hypothetical protein